MLVVEGVNFELINVRALPITLKINYYS
jgi:hypothetical protein